MNYPARVAPLAGIAPLVALGALRLLGGGAGPASVSAQPVELAPAPVAASRAEPTEASERLVALRRAHVASAEPLGSPILPPIEETADELFPEFEAPVGDGPGRPMVTVTSIISGPRPMAVINGELRHVGDDLGEGWIITEINPAAGAVIVAHPEADEPIRAGLDRR